MYNIFSIKLDFSRNKIKFKLVIRFLLMKKTLFCFLMLATALVKAQPTSVKKDSVVQVMLEEVSAKNIEATVRKLVSFQTRHTLSDTLSTKTGIGAARNWIKAEFEKDSE